MRGSRAAGGPDGDRRHGPAGPADGGEAAGRPTGQAGLPPGTAGIHPRLCPARQVGTAYELGCPRAARHSDRRTCHKRLSRAPPLLALTLHKSGFRGSFSLSARKSVLEGQANTVVAGGFMYLRGSLLVPDRNDPGQRPDIPARGGHATPMCPAVIATLSPASMAHKAAKTATARLWPRSGGTGARRQGRGGVGGATGRSRGKVEVFPMQSALLRLELSIPVPFSAQFSTRRCGCDYRPSPRLSPPGCRLPPFPRLHAPPPTSCGYSHLATRSCDSGQGLAGLVESVQVNVRIRGTDRK
jgi:hypothetical protein